MRGRKAPCLTAANPSLRMEVRVRSCSPTRLAARFLHHSSSFVWYHPYLCTETRRTVRGVIEVEPIAGFANASSSSSAASSSSCASAGASARRWQVPPEAIAAHRSGWLWFCLYLIEASLVLVGCIQFMFLFVFAKCRVGGQAQAANAVRSPRKARGESKSRGR